MGERRSGEPQRDQGKYEGWIPTAIGIAVIGLVVVGVHINRAIQESGEQDTQQLLDQTRQDGLTLVENSRGNVIDYDSGTRVHIALGDGSCSAWVTVVEKPEDSGDPQSYAMGLNGRDYYFTDHSSMLDVLGEDFCRPTFVTDQLN